MPDNKRFSIAMRAIALCLVVAPALQAVAGTEFSRASDDWEGSVAVGPGCLYSNLQSAIDDGASGLHNGHIGLHAEYDMSENYRIDDFNNGQGDPWIVGGFSSCNIDSLDNASDRTTLDADEDGRHFTIIYGGEEADPHYTVTLQNLRMINGRHEGDGGALYASAFHNRLTVELINTEIRGNRAFRSGTLSSGNGGGIYIWPLDTIVDLLPSGRPLIRPMLVLDDATNVVENTASGVGARGGGIACRTGSERNIQGVVVQTGAGAIAQNQAMSGGGVSAFNCNLILRNGGAVLPGVGANGGLAFNVATGGGGIYAGGSSQVYVRGQPSINYGGDSDSAALIFSNQAVWGGGILAEGEGTEVVLADAAVIANKAIDGGHGGGIVVWLQARVEFEARSAKAPCQPKLEDGGWVTYPPCNRLKDNNAEDRGGAAYVENGASLIVHDTYIRNNSADQASVARVFNSDEFGDTPAAKLEIENSLVTGNSEASTLFSILNQAHVDVRWSTIADNEYPDDSGHKFTLATIDHPMEPTLDMTGVILWSEHDDVGIAVRGAGAGDSTLTCGIGFVDPPIGLTDTAFYSHIDPEFQNPESGNYRLSFTSPAIDYCNDQPVPERDLDGRERDVAFGGDTTEAPNAHPDGIHDIGAFTVQEPMMFHDRFEAD